MNKIDIKLTYTLLCSSDILRYLERGEKAEFSYCCKYIYEKCSEIILQKLKFGVIEYHAYINNNNQKRLYWYHCDYEKNLQYFDAIVNRYEHYIHCLTYSAREYFLIEHFSLKFTNLSSLCLNNIILPKNILKNIIKNFTNLQSLALCDIIAVYSKNDIQVADFKFSKYLKKLVWTDCSQFELDIKDSSSIKQYGFGSNFENKSILDLSLNLLSTLINLDWHILGTGDRQLFNEIISNNPRLKNLRTNLSCFDSDSFKIISSNSNLTKLAISFHGDSINLDSSMLSKLLNIKTLELHRTFDDALDSIDLIMQNCPKLEELIFHCSYRSGNYLIRYINDQINLKLLKINCNYCELSFLDTVLPKSNLEKLEIISTNPIKFNFKNFTNMKKLKYINNKYEFPILEDENKVPESGELKEWRMISYPKSNQYWKI